MSEPSAQIVVIREKTVLRVRTWMPPQADRAPVAVAAKSLPSEVGATLPGPTRALCLGPQEWLIVSRECTASVLRSQLEADLASQGVVLGDLTQGLASFEIRGTAAREVLSQGCGLDLHPRMFPLGRCARTRFAQLAVVVECLDDPSRFVLHVGRSYAHYLHTWLLDAAAPQRRERRVKSKFWIDAV